MPEPGEWSPGVFDHGGGVREVHAGCGHGPYLGRTSPAQVRRRAGEMAETTGVTVLGVKVLGYSQRHGWAVSVLYASHGVVPRCPWCTGELEIVDDYRGVACVVAGCEFSTLGAMLRSVGDEEEARYGPQASGPAPGEVRREDETAAGNRKGVQVAGSESSSDEQARSTSAESQAAPVLPGTVGSDGRAGAHRTGEGDPDRGRH